MLTYTGIDMLPGGTAAPAPKDLAVQMGRICQYAGGVWFTLLAHSVFVSELVRLEYRNKPCIPDWALWTWAWALLHDAHEVVTGDVPRGWKTPEMKALQRELDVRIVARYNPEGQTADAAFVERADKRAIYVQGMCLDHGMGAYRKLRGSSQPEPSPEEASILDRIRRGPLNDPRECLDPKSVVIGYMEAAFACLAQRAPRDAIRLVSAVAEEGRNAWRVLA